MFISDEQEAQTEAWESYYHLKSSEKDYLVKINMNMKIICSRSDKNVLCFIKCLYILLKNAK